MNWNFSRKWTTVDIYMKDPIYTEQYTGTIALLIIIAISMPAPGHSQIFVNKVVLHALLLPIPIQKLINFDFNSPKIT